MGNYFFQIIIAIIESLICILIFSVIIKKNILIDDKRTSVSLSLSYVIIFILIREVIPFGVHPIIMTILNIIMFAIITKASIKSIVLSFTIHVIYSIMLEEIFYMFVAFYFKTSIMDVINHPQLHNSVGLISSTINLIILLIIIKFLNIKHNFTDGKDRGLIFNYWIIGLISFGFVMMSFEAMTKYGINIKYFNYAVYMIFLFFLILGYYQYKNFIEYMKMKYKFEKKEKELENLESMIDVIRKQKHDFANIINTVYAISVMNKPNSNDKIKSYLKSIINDSTTPNYFYDTGNDYLDGLLAMKKKYADNEKVNFEVDFDCSLEEVQVEDNDLVKIVSNIVDNALEVLKKYQNDNKVISIYHWIEDDISNISISNNGPMIKENLMKKIFDKGFTQKVKESKEHGYGLYIVKELVQKQNGKILVKSDENSTEFLIKLPMLK